MQPGGTVKHALATARLVRAGLSQERQRTIYQPEQKAYCFASTPYNASADSSHSTPCPLPSPALQSAPSRSIP